MSAHFIVLILALLIDRLIGDPPFLWRHIPHPVVLFGRAIAYFDQALNKAEESDRQRFWAGWGVMLLLMLCVAIFGLLLHALCLSFGVTGLILEALIASLFLAQKSLADHVGAVKDGFYQGGLLGARQAVSMIVGRDPEHLNESDVCRAAIESLAENSSDGVVAPVFWFALLGLPGLFAYKMLNTADSMIGHMNERYRSFGYAAAKLDDGMNFIPARLTAFLVLVVTFLQKGRHAAQNVFLITTKDSRHHASPNAGWPESAFAASLDIRLSGPRFYDGEMVDEPFQNTEGKAPMIEDISRALRLYHSMLTLLLALSALSCAIIICYSVLE